MNDLELELNIPFINEYCYLGITIDNIGVLHQTWRSLRKN